MAIVLEILSEDFHYAWPTSKDTVTYAKVSAHTVMNTSVFLYKMGRVLRKVNQKKGD